MIRRFTTFLRGILGGRKAAEPAPARSPDAAPPPPAPPVLAQDPEAYSDPYPDSDSYPAGSAGEVDVALAPESIRACEAGLGYTFKNPAFLSNAMTHSSRKGPNTPSNERLEFLGDSVLGLVTTEFIYQEYPDYDEGELTAIKSVVVSKPTLARLSQAVGLPRFLRVGRGISSQRQIPSSLQANVFEAVVAAIFLDGGLAAAKPFVLKGIVPEVKAVVENGHRQNFKSLLQQVAQRELRSTPAYRVLQERGPEHGKQFCVATVIRGQRYPAAWGDSKKDAEQRAAEKALHVLTRSRFQPRHDAGRAVRHLRGAPHGRPARVGRREGAPPPRQRSPAPSPPPHRDDDFGPAPEPMDDYDD